MKITKNDKGINLEELTLRQVLLVQALLGLTNQQTPFPIYDKLDDWLKQNYASFRYVREMNPTSIGLIGLDENILDNMEEALKEKKTAQPKSKIPFKVGDEVAQKHWLKYDSEYYLVTKIDEGNNVFYITDKARSFAPVAYDLSNFANWVVKGGFAREPNGRFKAKKWIASFSYPDSATGASVARKVVTDFKGKKNPSKTAHNMIKGFDLTRNAPRNFNVNRIRGQITWTREYVG